MSRSEKVQGTPVARRTRSEKAQGTPVARGSGLQSQDQGSPPEIFPPEFVESELPETGPIVGDFQLDPDARVFSNPLFPTESVATAIYADQLVNTSDSPEDEEKEYVVTFLDYRAAFDSVSHKFVDVALS